MKAGDADSLSADGCCQGASGRVEALLAVGADLTARLPSGATSVWVKRTHTHTQTHTQTHTHHTHTHT